jgi:hypothetical protein
MTETDSRLVETYVDTSPTPLPGNDNADRLQRLWSQLRPTFSHDLPNLLVALQGLLQMFNQEEAGALGNTGKEYLQRMSAVTQKLQGMAGALRLLSRNANFPAEDVLLAELLRELAAVGKQLFPGSHFLFHSLLRVPQIRAPRLPLQQILLELLRVLVLPIAPGDIHLFAASRRCPGAIELMLGRWPEGMRLAEAEPVRAVRNLDPDAFGPEHRLSLILADDWMRQWGGRVETGVASPHGRSVRITIPESLRIEPPAPAPATAGH